MPYIVGNSVFMWMHGSLLNPHGAEVCHVDVVTDSAGTGFRVTWSDGETASYVSEPAARDAIDRRLLALESSGLVEEPRAGIGGRTAVGGVFERRVS